MKLRLLKAWGRHPSGTILEPHKSVRMMLLKGGLAEPVKAERKSAVVEPPENAATTKRPKRRYKRRRKQPKPEPQPAPAEDKPAQCD